MKVEINYRKKNEKRTNVETKQHITKKKKNPQKTQLNQRRNEKIPQDK